MGANSMPGSGYQPKIDALLVQSNWRLANFGNLRLGFESARHILCWQGRELTAAQVHDRVRPWAVLASFSEAVESNSSLGREKGSREAVTVCTRRVL